MRPWFQFSLSHQTSCKSETCWSWTSINWTMICLTDIGFLSIKVVHQKILSLSSKYTYTKTQMSRRPHEQPSKGSYSAPDTVSSRTDSRHDWDFSQSKIMLSGHFIPTTSTIESTAMIFNCRISRSSPIHPKSEKLCGFWWSCWQFRMCVVEPLVVTLCKIQKMMVFLMIFLRGSSDCVPGADVEQWLQRGSPPLGDTQPIVLLCISVFLLFLHCCSFSGGSFHFRICSELIIGDDCTVWENKDFLSFGCLRLIRSIYYIAIYTIYVAIYTI